MHRVVLLLSLLLVGCATCPLSANGPTGSRLGNIFLNHAPVGKDVVLDAPLFVADLIQYAACP